MLKDSNPAVKYCKAVLQGKINAPKFVKIQCEAWLVIAKGKNKRFIVNETKMDLAMDFLGLLVVAKGLKAGRTVKEALSGFQWFFIIAVLCTVERKNPKKRKYETAILEICRKNGKTFLIAVLFILLFLMEPKFSMFYSVAPDGALSRELKDALEKIIASSPALNDNYQGRRKFKILRDYIYCNLTDNKYVPLNYSNSTLDGKLPNVFLVDETGGLPNTYAIEAMRSGQLTILNKLGCIISTKYPTINNPFEDEVGYAKRVLQNIIEDEKIFALLFEPDNTKDWMADDGILEQANPLALDLPSVMEDLKDKRNKAIEIPAKRENFVTKHCNIIYSGVGTETFVDIHDLQKGRRKQIDWRGRNVFLGVDLSMTNDNCSVVMAAWDETDEAVLAAPMIFIPEGRIVEKTKFERFDYDAAIKAGECIACGDRTVDYAVIESYVMCIEETFGVKVLGIGFDRYNALSSAQKWDEKYETIEIKQHSSVLHPPTKWCSELVANGKLYYVTNKLFEINFENARCVYDTNMNRYVNKKKSAGKVDAVVGLLNAMYLLYQEVVLDAGNNWTVQT